MQKFSNKHSTHAFVRRRQLISNDVITTASVADPQAVKPVLQQIPYAEHVFPVGRVRKAASHA